MTSTALADLGTPIGDALQQDHPAAAQWPAPVVGPVATWRTAADSVNPAAIKRYILASRGPKIDLVIGYPDFGWQPEDFAYFEAHGYPVARITQRDPADYIHCSIFDYERGAIFGPQLRHDIISRQGFRPGTATAYADISNLPAVGSVLAGLSYHVWAAWWPTYPDSAEIADIERKLRPGAHLVAVQWINEYAADIDLSVVIDPAWHSQ